MISWKALENFQEKFARPLCWLPRDPRLPVQRYPLGFLLTPFPDFGR